MIVEGEPGSAVDRENCAQGKSTISAAFVRRFIGIMSKTGKELHVDRSGLYSTDQWCTSGTATWGAPCLQNAWPAIMAYPFAGRDRQKISADYWSTMHAC